MKAGSLPNITFNVSRVFLNPAKRKFGEAANLTRGTWRLALAYSVEFVARQALKNMGPADSWRVFESLRRLFLSRW